VCVNPVTGKKKIKRKVLKKKPGAEDEGARAKVKKSR
jgi:hypothetical protein